MSQNIKTQINYLTEEFNRVFQIELWNKYPVEKVNELDDPVNNKDSFTARLIGLVATFDALNKTRFDKESNIKSEGGRLALVNYLKSQLSGYDFQIDEVIITLNMISLLRTQFAHTGNKSKRTAMDYFGIVEPIEDFRAAWDLVERKFQVFLQELTGLIAKKNAPLHKQQQLQEQAIETAFLFTIKKHKRYLEDNPIAKVMLREIAVRGEYIDTELAQNLLQPVQNIRRLLFPFTGSLLRVSYHSNDSTLIIMDRFRDEIKNIDDWLNR